MPACGPGPEPVYVHAKVCVVDDVWADGLVDPDEAVESDRDSAAALQVWHESGRVGPRPPGRLRPHAVHVPPRWQRMLAGPAYRTVFDPDGRPPRMKPHRRH